jgi:hypothetical protein
VVDIDYSVREVSLWLLLSRAWRQVARRPRETDEGPPRSERVAGADRQERYDLMRCSTPREVAQRAMARETLPAVGPPGSGAGCGGDNVSEFR